MEREGGRWLGVGVGVEGWSVWVWRRGRWFMGVWRVALVSYVLGSGCGAVGGHWKGEWRGDKVVGTEGGVRGGCDWMGGCPAR